MPENGISDEELLKRISATNTEALVVAVAKELANARAYGKDRLLEKFHARFTSGMYGLDEFMKPLLQRFAGWVKETQHHKGKLWEDCYKSEIVESGIAARATAGYIDLYPVLAGMVSDPSDYRWSSYGEAVGCGPWGNGKKSREGLMNICMSQNGADFEAVKWNDISQIYRRAMGLALEKRSGKAELEMGVAHSGMDTANSIDTEENETALPDLKFASIMRCRVRYLIVGMVISSKMIVKHSHATFKRHIKSWKTCIRKLSGGSDYDRWTPIDNLVPDWDSRTFEIAKLIEDNSFVLEFGAGRQILREYLPGNCRYIPSDIVDRGNETIVCDLNGDSLPNFPICDVAVFSGVLEYVNDVPNLVDYLKQYVGTIIASYAILESNKKYRRNYGWVNDFTTEEFIEVFTEVGFSLVHQATWRSQIIFVFKKSGIQDVNM